MSEVLGSVDLSQVDEEIQALAAPLKKKRDALLNYRRNLIEEREQVDKEVAKINRAIRPLEAESAEKKASKKASSSGTHVSPETIKRVEEWISAQDGFVTRKQVAEALDLSESGAGAAINRLREDEKVRYAGKQGREQQFAMMEVTHV